VSRVPGARHSEVLVSAWGGPAAGVSRAPSHAPSRLTATGGARCCAAPPRHPCSDFEL